ncbi:serine/threonine protein phosphatase 1 [Rhodobacter sp. 24-YEA-8]|nr:serine/threonine protein phosphatase 1 [Rhodobacter sp. 24-YEA-8]
MVFSFLRRAATPARRPALRADERMTTRPGLPPPCPDEPVCLLGDLHGRSDLLKRFLTLRAAHFPNARIIFLGDMIDRGPDSAGILSLVREEVAKGAVALSGNHEAMFLDFLDQPEKGLSWLKHGGVEMLASYGLEPDRPDSLCDRIRATLGEDMIAWLRALPLSWQSGTLAAAHAGMDPQRPVTDQEPQVLQWGHRDFGRILRTDGIWVAHGHTVMDRAFAHAGRIALDTGAYATGRLSFAVIDPDLPETERLMIAVTP